MSETTRQFLGDMVWAHYQPDLEIVTLTVEGGIRKELIHLDAGVYAALVAYMNRMREAAAKPSVAALAERIADKIHAQQEARGSLGVAAIEAIVAEELEKEMGEA